MLGLYEDLGRLQKRVAADEELQRLQQAALKAVWTEVRQLREARASPSPAPAAVPRSVAAVAAGARRGRAPGAQQGRSHDPAAVARVSRAPTPLACRWAHPARRRTGITPGGSMGRR